MKVTERIEQGSGKNRLWPDRRLHRAILSLSEQLGRSDPSPAS